MRKVGFGGRTTVGRLRELRGGRRVSAVAPVVTGKTLLAAHSGDRDHLFRRIMITDSRDHVWSDGLAISLGGASDHRDEVSKGTPDRIAMSLNDIQLPLASRPKASCIPLPDADVQLATAFLDSEESL